MSSFCLACHEEAVNERIVCTECKQPYHLGTCSGVSESTFKSKGELHYKSWKCPTCRVGKTRSGSIGKAKLDTDVACMLVEMNKKLDALPALKETVDHIERSIEMMSDKYDELLQRIEKQDGEIRDLKTRVDRMEECKQEDTIQQLRRDVDELEWRSRRLNLEFHGIPKSENEDLLSKVNEEIASKVGVPQLVKSEVSAIHRLPSRPGKVPGVIVRFTSQETRDKWLEGKKSLRGTSLYVTENMTKHSRTLLAATKEWAKTKGYMYTWHKNGKVHLRKRDGEPVILIKSEQDLISLD